MTVVLPLDVLPDAEAGALPSPSVETTARLAVARGGVITIGNFDGVHRGHAALLGRVRQRANDAKIPAVAVVLDPHPATILRPEHAPTRLTWIERRAQLMEPLGIDALVVCRTSKAFLSMPAADFFKSIVVGHLNAQAMVEGPNFFFGRDRGGDIITLGDLCRDRQIDLEIVEPTRVGDQMISSTRIRQRLDEGQVREAAELLGAPYRIRGTVSQGAGRGRKIGFPTANLTGIDVVVPQPGVYGGYARLDGESSAAHLAAIHIGPNPTFESDGEWKVEIHLLDQQGDLYGQLLLVDFHTRVRDIARFDSADVLVQQLNQDIKTIRTRLDTHPAT